MACLRAVGACVVRTAGGGGQGFESEGGRAPPRVVCAVAAREPALSNRRGVQHTGCRDTRTGLLAYKRVQLVHAFMYNLVYVQTLIAQKCVHAPESRVNSTPTCTYACHHRLVCVYSVGDDVDRERQCS